jgi:hypothetical protein
VTAAVPDYPEPFEAWRAWRVVRRHDALAIGSIVRSTVWPAGEPLVAECLRPLRKLRDRLGRHGPQVPAESCDCGIYGARLDIVGHYLTELAGRDGGGSVHVVGRVLLWGEVVECERGYRASHAYPARLYVLAHERRARDVALGLRRYGVPIELLPAGRVDATDLLARRLAA